MYRLTHLNPASSYHLSIRVDYPNAFDRARGRGGRPVRPRRRHLHPRQGRLHRLPGHRRRQHRGAVHARRRHRPRQRAHRARPRPIARRARGRAAVDARPLPHDRARARDAPRADLPCAMALSARRSSGSRGSASRPTSRAVRALRRRRGAPWFELGGECRRCARCCEAPSIRANALVWHLRIGARGLSLVAAGGQRLRAAGGPAAGAHVRVPVHPLRLADRGSATATRRARASAGTIRAPCSISPLPELLPGCGYRASDARRAAGCSPCWTSSR